MITAVDTSILLDILLDDPQFARASFDLLQSFSSRGALIACPIVFAEAAVAFDPPAKFASIAAELGIAYDDFSPEVAFLAARMWRQYRQRGGARKTMLADFFIGAHAQHRAEALLTRDRGYFRDYFDNLSVVGPEMA